MIKTSRMPIIVRLFVSTFFIVLNFYCLGQQGTHTKNDQSPTTRFETHLRASLISWYRKYPQEEVFVHTNQDYYSSGETMWYKVYAMAYGKPTALSKIIYVRLTDTAGNLIVQNMLPLTDGNAHGNMDIYPKLKTGWYELSAFTSWMMNFEPQTYFRQRIYIRNVSDSISAPSSMVIKKKLYHINFFPESGDLVDGNISTIAFRASDEDGLPAVVEGVVTDIENKTNVKFTTMHNGMGEFAVQAVAGSSYLATVHFPDGSQQNIKLPEVKSTGICLQGSQTSNTIHLKVAFSGPSKKFENCILAAVQNSGQIYTCPLHLSKGVNDFDLLKRGFSSGILRLTVFDGDGLPQAERILFINNHDLQISQLKTDTLSFSPRKLNSFSAVIRDTAGNPVKGNFSVAVTDGDAFNCNSGQNIFSALLLNPELKGEIYDPAYYFKNESDSLARQLDLVMLTNGWRRFLWQKILNNENNPLQYPVEQSPYIAGQLLDYEKLPHDKNKLNIKLLIINQDSTKFVGEVTPDSAGRFILKDFNHAGISDIYLQITDKKNHTKKLPVKIFTTLNDSLEKVRGDSFEDHAIPDIPKYYLSAAKKQERETIAANGIMLNTVNIKDKKLTPTEKLIAEHVSLKYTSDRSFTLDLVNNPTVNMDLIDYIRGRFPNLQVLGDSGHPVFIYRGGNTLQSPSSNNSLPYFYLNETLVQYFAISDIPLINIAMIRFMPPPVWFAPYNGGNVGAIMVYTKKSLDEAIKTTALSENSDHYIFNGFSISREFSAPNYSHQRPNQENADDNRLTLYWNHDLNTDSNGVLRFRFYNSDGAKKFKVVIQGMDNQGRVVYLRKILE